MPEAAEDSAVALSAAPAAEIPLTGGNVAQGVVRIGDTVRKPAGPAAAGIEALLGHLASVGFSGAPRCHGRDERGRLVLEYIPGPLADTLPAFSRDQLSRIGALIRDLHDAAAEFTAPADVPWDVPIPPDRADLLCHHDLAPWNLVLADDGSAPHGRARWVFIDWDGVGPGSRLWDLGYAAHGFTPLHPGGDPEHDAPRLRALVDGYRLDEAGRERLPQRIADHVQGMYDLLFDGARTGRQPWARLYAEGHGDHWGPAADYIRRHEERWRAALLD